MWLVDLRVILAGKEEANRSPGKESTERKVDIGQHSYMGKYQDSLIVSSSVESSKEVEKK